MGLFDDPTDLFTIWADGLSPGTADVASARVAAEIFRAGIRPDLEHEEALARSRWLAEQRAEISFPCGVVVVDADAPAPGEDPWARPSQMPATAVAVTAVVVPDAVVFLREPVEGVDVDLVVELGRIPRTSIVEVDVVDASGTHVPEVADETLEPSEPVQLVLRWSNDGVPDDDRFGFRSAWSAWDAGRRLRLAKLSVK
jgi:hypothetical protein